VDSLKYKRLWPRYIADMYALRTDQQNKCKALEEGNIPLTKITNSFMGIGADHGYE